MPGIPNLSSLVMPNVMESLGAALDPAKMAAHTAALNKQGWDAIGPYVQALSKNPQLSQSSQFTGRMETIAKQFRLPIPVVRQAIEQTRAQLQPPAGAQPGQSGGQKPGPNQGQNPQQPGAQANPQQPQGQPGGQPQSQPSQPGAQAPPGGAAPGGASGQPADMGGMPQAAPMALNALMAAAGIQPQGLQAFGSLPISPQQAQYIAQNTSPGRAREVAYASIGIDPRTVPADALNAPRQMSEAQILSESQKIPQQMLSYVSKGIDPSGYLNGQVAMGSITAQQAQAYMSDPQFVSQMRSSALANMNVLRENGLLRGAQYEKTLKGIESATSTAEVQQARAGLLKKQLSSFDELYLDPAKARTQSAESRANLTDKQIDAFNQNQQIKVERASADIARVNTMIGDSQSGSWAQRMAVGQRAAALAQQSYNSLFQAGSRATAAFADPSAITVDDQGTTYNQALQTAKETLDLAKKNATDLKTNFPSNASRGAIETNNTSVTVKGKTSGGGAQGGYTVGEVKKFAQGAFKYLGGDPNSAASWQKMQ